MKKTNLTFAGLILLAGFTACNDDSTSTTTTTSDSSNRSTMNGGDSNNAMNNSATTDNNNSTTAANNNMNKTPLAKDDSVFVMKAAMGGMMEVEAGNMAQTNAMNDRVKSFGMMMVNDHTKANSELMSLVSGRATLPTEMSADMKKHGEAMSKMKGKDFDRHYMSMMLNDHKKDIALFEKQASSGTDADLKAFAAKTLPTLKMHLDSAQAISKMK
jgi:putative membrane protein